MSADAMAMNSIEHGYGIVTISSPSTHASQAFLADFDGVSRIKTHIYGISCNSCNGVPKMNSLSLMLSNFPS